MNINQTFEYIESLQSLGSHLGLESVTELCKRLGNPQDQLKFVHIAGTNGKGSILALVSTALSANGIKTGRYISPTISDYRERFQINGKMITKKALCEYVDRIKKVCDEMVEEGLSHPTPFEFETALAFLYFHEMGCEIVVLECGMGGETDATNIIKTTLISVFASIGLDHTGFLGTTIQDIARVKSGIIKKGTTVVSAMQESVVRLVLEEKAREMDASFYMVDEKDGKLLGKYDGGIKIRYKSYDKLKISLMGTYQYTNACTALEVLERLKNVYDFSLSEEKIKKAFETVVWEGRFEKIGKKPLFFMDGAHNPPAAKRLADTIGFYFTNRPIIYIMGVLKDKDFDTVISETYGYADMILTVKPPHNERALSAYELATAVSRYAPNVTAVDSLEEAVEMAYLLAGKDTVIIAFGSLSYLGELKKIVQKKAYDTNDAKRLRVDL